LQKHKR